MDTINNLLSKLKINSLTGICDELAFRRLGGAAIVAGGGKRPGGAKSFAGKSRTLGESGAKERVRETGRNWGNRVLKSVELGVVVVEEKSLKF